MRNAIVLISAAVLAGAMVVGGLWAWQSAAELTLGWDVARPDLILWAVRSAAVAMAAAAQVILLAVVGGRLYGRGSVRHGVCCVPPSWFSPSLRSAWSPADWRWR